MVNIDISQFSNVSSVDINDHVLLVRSTGTNGKIRMSLIVGQMKADVSPSIGTDGYWYIGGENTNVKAEGRTPEFALVEGNICVRYSEKEAWNGIVSLNELRLDYDSLTDEQVAQLKMTIDDLTEEDIAKLQQPALEAAVRADEATEDSKKQTGLAKTATDNANDTADHPTYIGADNYVYQWDKAARAYDKTSIYVRGEAFSISKVFTSVAQMNSYAGSDLKEGDFCLINTGSVEDPDTAKLYVRTPAGTWNFLVDMSGAIGFTGKTPQMFAGTVTTGNPDTQAVVTVTANGTDSDGNPKYDINFTIPKGDTFRYEDLTQENIEELQRPANDMIAVLERTNNDIAAEEAGRVKTENERAAAETERKNAETERKAAETERKTAETARKNAEKERTANEDIRLTDEETRKENEKARVSNETYRQTSESTRQQQFETAKANAEKATDNANAVSHNSPKIVDEYWQVYELEAEGYVPTSAHALGKSPYISPHGTWMVYNDSTGEWEDTEKSVNSTFDLTKAKVEAVLNGDIITHTHEHLRYVAQVYEDTPDFDTLVSWSDGQGEHKFLQGNDIYVRNDSEPTGYANYKLAVTRDGNKWVRIPQVAQGWRIVMVKEA